MKLPSPHRAVVDIRKLRDYCLDSRSPKGRDKARVFAAALGLTHSDADLLRRALLRAAVEQDCAAGEADQYGRRYTVDFEMETSAGRHRIRSGWIVRSSETFPRLTTCYVMKAKRTE
jgi:hypothetical protein